jgi:hypothetical protein
LPCAEDVGSRELPQGSSRRVHLIGGLLAVIVVATFFTKVSRVEEPTETVGTRHRATYRLCQRVHEAMAIVVSQDGSVRFVAHKNGAVTYWDQLVDLPTGGMSSGCMWSASGLCSGSSRTSLALRLEAFPSFRLGQKTARAHDWTTRRVPKRIVRPARLRSMRSGFIDRRLRAHGAHRSKPRKLVVMGNRLYVGNLSFSTTREALEAAFASAGNVREVAMPTDRETGQPRGFAFVTMGNEHEASAAIAQLDGLMLDGRPLRVNEAQERSGGFGGGRGGGGRGGSGGARGDRY